MRELTQKVIDKLPKKFVVHHVDEQETFPLCKPKVVDGCVPPPKPAGEEVTLDRICVIVETPFGEYKTALFVPHDMVDETLIGHWIKGAKRNVIEYIAPKIQKRDGKTGDENRIAAFAEAEAWVELEEGTNDK